MRFHGLFHDDMFVYREDEQPAPIYNFQYVDDVFDRMLATGVRPFVELSFAPTEMATAHRHDVLVEGQWRSALRLMTSGPPWCSTSSITASRATASTKCASWYFEVWNEPNLTDGFFKGTQRQYFDLYKITAETIKKSRSATQGRRPHHQQLRSR